MATDKHPDLEEPIEGLGEDEDVSFGEYPIDTMLIRQESRTVHDVLRRIEKGAFVMDPEFQRDFIWPPDKQSKLIESVLMRIPLPVFYTAEDSEGRMVVVDGLQRLSTFQNFWSDNLPLRLPEQTELNGKRFSDLSAKLQNRIEDCNLIFYIIDSKVAERAKLDIFDRVNSGVPLTRQQMRNSLYNGQATRFLKEEATTALFKEATGGSLKTEKMRDREFVNRFCAFQLLPVSAYKDMDEFLALGLRRMNELGQGALEQLRDQFQLSLRNNYRVFQSHAFRKHTDPTQYRSVLNASLWDVMSTGLSRYAAQLVEARASELRTAFYQLMANQSFTESITYSVNDPIRVKRRFDIATRMFREVLDDYQT